MVLLVGAFSVIVKSSVREPSDDLRLKLYHPPHRLEVRQVSGRWCGDQTGLAAVRINSDNYTSQIIGAKPTKNLHQSGEERVRRGAAGG